MSKLRPRQDDGIPGCLTGSYEIRAGSIVGWVDKIPYATTDMTVEANRLGIPIAACAAQPAHGGDRHPFTLPIENRFTTAELAHETIIITARSRRGDTGTLKLEGAAQLELIRAHLGVPVETLLDLDFTSAGNARPHLGEGWSAPEETFTWAENTNSLVHFPSPAPPGPFLLRMRFAAFITPLIPTQKLDLYMNDEWVADHVATDSATEYREFRLPPEPFALAPQTTLRLHHPYAARPSEHAGTRDTRRLAFSLRRLTLVRILPDQI